MATNCFNNRIRISSNCVELIFGKGHLSTTGVSRDAVFLILLSARGNYDPQQTNAGQNVWSCDQAFLYDSQHQQYCKQPTCYEGNMSV